MGTGIKIEVLYGEFANLFGDLQNVNNLKSCIPDAEVIYTGLHDKPAFADGGADFVYMGSMTENQQELAIEALTPYKEELAAQIKLDSPKTIVDLGCGPGNSTENLLKRFPNADILGVDSSEDMLEAAREKYKDTSLRFEKMKFARSFPEDT